LGVDPEFYPADRRILVCGWLGHYHVFGSCSRPYGRLKNDLLSVEKEIKLILRMVAFVYISFEKAFTYMVWLIHDFESGKGSQVVEGIYFSFSV